MLFVGKAGERVLDLLPRFGRLKRRALCVLLLLMQTKTTITKLRRIYTVYMHTYARARCTIVLVHSSCAFQVDSKMCS